MNMIAVLFAALAVISYLAIAVMLVRKYLHTREAGFIWLGVAAIVWPVVSRILDRGGHSLIERAVNDQSISFYPFSLIERGIRGGDITIGGFDAALATGQQLVGAVLLLVAVLYLYRLNNGRQAVSN
jgi:hypothetical protein